MKTLLVRRLEPLLRRDGWRSRRSVIACKKQVSAHGVGRSQMLERTSRQRPGFVAGIVPA